MSKRGIIGRVTQLSRADVNDLIDLAEDPPKVVDRLVRTYAATIAEAEQAIAQHVLNLGIAELDQEEDAGAAGAWSRAAETTSQRADQLRAAGGAADADRFDALARIALKRQLTVENDIKVAQRTIAAHTESIETLANGLEQMRIRLTEIIHQRDSLAGRSGGAQASNLRLGAPLSLDVLDPASDVARFEEMVRQEEARPQEAGVPDGQLAEPGHTANVVEVEERLMALKTGRAMAAAMARAQVQPLR